MFLVVVFHLTPVSPPRFQRHSLPVKLQTIILLGVGTSRFESAQKLKHAHTHTHTYTFDLCTEVYNGGGGGGGRGLSRAKHTEMLKVEKRRQTLGQGTTAAFRRAALRSQKSV